MIRLKHRPISAALTALVLGWLGAISVSAGELAAPCAYASELGAGAVGSAGLGDPSAPESASGYRSKSLTRAKSYMVVAAHPLASKAGCEVLQKGGSAMDAAVAVQGVLGLVEPQSSGLGGGAFLLHYDAKTKQIHSYDGRETAPHAATADYLRFISDSVRSPPLPVLALPDTVDAFNQLRQSGRSIGTPGVMRMLEMAHQDHGRLHWNRLFDAGIALAQDGFAIGGRLADAIAGTRTFLQADREAARYFLDSDGAAKSLGTVLHNPAYAATLRALASRGADALHSGAIAEGILGKIHRTSGGSASFAMTPGLTAMQDLRSYRAIRRDPVCTTYRKYWICGMGPPSSGGMTVASAMGILENFDLASLKPEFLDAEGGKPSSAAVHLISEAERLAYADRNKYVADTDFVPLPGGSSAALLDKAYLRGRAQGIRFDRSMGLAQPGEFGLERKSSSAVEGKGTTQITIVDAQGNVVSMTSSIESAMGSFRMTHGFLLNNQLTDFSTVPGDASGPIANRLEPGKRPRSSMAPTLVFRKEDDGSIGDFVLATGSPGGPAIIQYVIKTLVGVLDWDMSAQQATSMVDFGAANGATTYVGGEHPHIRAKASSTEAGSEGDALLADLRAKGHRVNTAAQISGVATIVKTRHQGQWVLEGGADPRREGIALGDALLH